MTSEEDEQVCNVDLDSLSFDLMPTKIIFQNFRENISPCVCALKAHTQSYFIKE